MAEFVRNAVMQVSNDVWLLGGDMLLVRGFDPHANYTWRSRSIPHASYTLVTTQAPSLLARPLSADTIFRPMYDRGDSTAVWDLDGAFFKVHACGPKLPAMREFVTLQWMAERTWSFLFPKVIYHADYADHTYLLMTAVPGIPLNDAWRDMNMFHKYGCIEQVCRLILEMAEWTSDSMTKVDGSELADSFIGRCLNPDQSAESLLENCAMLGMDCSELVLSHNDLHPGNIIVNEEFEVVGIIDFELAGFVPPQWIATKFRVCQSMDFLWPDHDASSPELGTWRLRMADALRRCGIHDVGMRMIEWRMAEHEEWVLICAKQQAEDAAASSGGTTTATEDVRHEPR